MAKVKWEKVDLGIHVANVDDDLYTVTTDGNGKWVAKRTDQGSVEWTSEPFKSSGEAMRAAESEATQQRARPHLKWFANGGFTVNKSTAAIERRTLKAAGWINYQHGMWGLTTAGRTEAERLNYL